MANKRMPKCTKVQKEQRVYRVYKLICKGEGRADIARYTAENWGMSYRQTDEYIRLARELMKEDFRMSRDEFAVEILEGYRDLRRRAIADKQHAVALGCLTRMAAMTNVDGSLDGRKQNAPNP